MISVLSFIQPTQNPIFFALRDACSLQEDVSRRAKKEARRF